MPKVLAIDLGASTGRAIIGNYTNHDLKLDEIHRFGDYVNIDGDNLSWNLSKIMEEIYKSMTLADKKYGFDSIAVDTWGVDFGLLDTDGNLIRNPIHYRDPRTKGMIQEIKDTISLESLYEKTGIQIMEINTLFQLLYLKKYEPDVYEKTEKILLMPDLINYLLTGEIFAEKSIASTSQLFDPNTMDWNDELIELFGLKDSLFPPIISAGDKVGTLKDSLQHELSLDKKAVISVTGHDTACAISSIPSQNENPLFLSSGTWSLLGKEMNKPVISSETRKYNLSNEVGSEDNITLLSNITGLWVIQESKRYYEEKGIDYIYSQITEEAEKINDSHSYIDVDEDRFGEVSEMPRTIDNYLKETKQETVKSPGHLFRIIYESLAMKYREKLDEIENVASDNSDELFVIGGGSKAEILCQFTANVTGKKIIAGPSEATAYGNILLQFISLKALDNLKEGRRLIKELSEIKVYEPINQKEWDRKYKAYKSNLNKGF